MVNFISTATKAVIFGEASAKAIKSNIDDRSSDLTDDNDTSHGEFADVFGRRYSFLGNGGPSKKVWPFATGDIAEPSVESHECDGKNIEAETFVPGTRVRYSSLNESDQRKRNAISLGMPFFWIKRAYQEKSRRCQGKPMFRMNDEKVIVFFCHLKMLPMEAKSGVIHLMLNKMSEMSSIEKWIL